MRAGSATPTLDIDAFRQELAQFDFATARPLTELLDWSIGMLEHGLVHLTHPRYFGLFNPAPTFPAQCADRIVNSFNPQVASSATSPAAVALEAHVIRSIAQRAGFPAGAGGHFTSGGSEANYTALLCALDARASRHSRRDGARAFPGQPVFYVSKECHRSWVKIAHQAGIGRSAARLVATDGRGRLSAAALADAIAAGSRRRLRAVSHRRLGRHDQRGHGRSVERVRRPRRTARALVPRGCRLGWGYGRLATSARRGCRTRARGFGDDRCSQVVRDDHGMRHVFWFETRRHWPRHSRLRRVTCHRTNFRSIPT